MDHNTIVGNINHMELEFLNPEDNEEVEDFKQYFRWLVPNMGPNIPAQAIKFLTKFI